MTTLLLTPAEAELQRMLDGAGVEFLDGQVVERESCIRSAAVASMVMGLVGVFTRDPRSGRVFGAGMGYRCFPRDPRQVRKPDVSFVAADRITPALWSMEYIPFAPDLAVEVVSPNDSYEYLEQKVAEYRSAGVRLIWIVNPGTRSVLIRRLDRTCAELDDTGSLDGEDVVPGFACRVAELFV